MKNKKVEVKLFIRWLLVFILLIIVTNYMRNNLELLEGIIVATGIIIYTYMFNNSLLDSIKYFKEKKEIKTKEK